MDRFILARITKPKSVVVDGNGDLVVVRTRREAREIRKKVISGTTFKVYRLQEVPEGDRPR